MDGIQPEPVDVIVAEPHPRVVTEESADARAAGSIKIDRLAPRSSVILGEIGAKTAQVVSVRAQMVVDNIQQHRDTACMARIDQPLQADGSSISMVGREKIYAVISPAAIP